MGLMGTLCIICRLFQPRLCIQMIQLQIGFEVQLVLRSSISTFSLAPFSRGSEHVLGRKVPPGLRSLVRQSLWIQMWPLGFPFNNPEPRPHFQNLIPSCFSVILKRCKTLSVRKQSHVSGYSRGLIQRRVFTFIFSGFWIQPLVRTDVLRFPFS